MISSPAKLFLPDIESSKIAERISVQLADLDSPRITHLDLFITEACNLRCEYCFVEGKSTKSMELSTSLAAIDFCIKRLGPENCLELLFFGGEPLLAFDVMRKTIKYCEWLSASLGCKFKF